MDKVKDVFRLPQGALTKGDLGIEVEVEGVNLPHVKSYWREEYDGSLRGESKEYVFNSPKSLVFSRKALTYLDKKFKANGTVMHESVRAGVHVHVNVQELSLVELYSFITAYLLLENLLVKSCGPTREGNLFCLRADDADYLLTALQSAIRTRKLRVLGDENLRYASLNVMSLQSYGSLEFRAMRSTRDFTLIGDWAETLLNLRESSRSFKDPSEIAYTYSSSSPEEFLISMVGEGFAESLMGLDGWQMLMQQGLRNAQDIAYCTNWEKLLEKPTSPFRRNVWAVIDEAG